MQLNTGWNGPPALSVGRDPPDRRALGARTEWWTSVVRPTRRHVAAENGQVGRSTQTQLHFSGYEQQTGSTVLPVLLGPTSPFLQRLICVSPQCHGLVDAEQVKACWAFDAMALPAKSRTSFTVSV
jgi:hypothetical protein